MIEDMPPEVMSLIDELKSKAEKYEGRTPPYSDNDFWDVAVAMYKVIQENKVPITLTEIASYIGVPYGPFRTYIYKKMKKASKEENEDNTVEIEKEQSISNSEKKEVYEEVNKRNRSDAPVTKLTEVKMVSSVTRNLANKAENVIQGETERLIKIGTIFRDNYEKLCYQNGYEDPETCLSDMASALFDVVPQYEELKEEFEVCQKLFKFFIEQTKPLISKFKTAKMLIDNFIKMSLIEDNDELSLDLIMKNNEKNASY